MIKKYNQYIKENNIAYSSDEIDPLGEENWDEWDDDLTPILRIVKKTGSPYDQITILNCNDQSLTSLEGVENLINLKKLYCSNNNLTSLRGIENLINLEKLNCHNNNLTNLEGIENLVNLKELYCSFNILTDLKGIENLINLQYLSCKFNNFSNNYKQYLIDYCKNKIYLKA